MKKAQAGIGTLIMFIAMLIVASITVFLFIFVIYFTPGSIVMDEMK